MKVKGMPCDQYKMSIEARPLQVLYTKYNPCEGIPQCQAVRPLGRIRRPSSEQSHNKQKDADEGGNAKHAVSKDIKLNRRTDSERIRGRIKGEQIISTLDYRDREHTVFPLMNLSRSQAFENKFKIAAARGNGQDTHFPKPQKVFDKKVVQLPLFQIDLKTYVGETEVSRTVAKTRESLRKLMELHNSKMKSNSITTANIRNYEFNAPVTSGLSTSRSLDPCSNSPLCKPFHAKPALRTGRVQGETKGKYSPLSRQPTKLSVIDRTESKMSVHCSNTPSSETPCLSKRQSFFRHRIETPGIDDELDDSILSVAMRPDTSLTLASTMHHIDRVFKSPGSDELRELNEALKTTDPQPAWPQIDEVQRLMGPSRSQSRNRRSRTSFSRPGTVLHDVLETPDDIVEGLPRPYPYLGQGYSPKPVLRYTSKQSAYKLDPIIVPSHTCTECPMCNIYHREIETPPNTPNTSHLMLERETTPIHSPLTRGAKLGQRQEVMHMSMISMDNCISNDTCNVPGYLNAS